MIFSVTDGMSMASTTVQVNVLEVKGDGPRRDPKALLSIEVAEKSSTVITRLHLAYVVRSCSSFSSFVPFFIFFLAYFPRQHINTNSRYFLNLLFVSNHMFRTMIPQMIRFVSSSFRCPCTGSLLRQSLPQTMKNSMSILPLPWRTSTTTRYGTVIYL